MGSSWVPFSVGCLPPPHWMGLVLFCLQLETPQEGQVWRMEHHTSGGKCREEGRRNQALCPVPLLLPSTSAWPLCWTWRIYSGANKTAAGQAAGGSSRGNFGCGSQCVELPGWHLHATELVDVTVTEKPWLAGDSVLSATWGRVAAEDGAMRSPLCSWVHPPPSSASHCCGLCAACSGLPAASGTLAEHLLCPHVPTLSPPGAEADSL